MDVDDIVMKIAHHLTDGRPCDRALWVLPRPSGSGDLTHSELGGRPRALNTWMAELGASDNTEGHRPQCGNISLLTGAPSEADKVASNEHRTRAGPAPTADDGTANNIAYDGTANGSADAIDGPVDSCLIDGLVDNTTDVIQWIQDRG